MASEYSLPKKIKKISFLSQAVILLALLLAMIVAVASASILFGILYDNSNTGWSHATYDTHVYSVRIYQGDVLEISDPEEVKEVRFTGFLDFPTYIQTPFVINGETLPGQTCRYDDYIHKHFCKYESQTAISIYSFQGGDGASLTFSIEASYQMDIRVIRGLDYYLHLIWPFP